MQNQKGFTLIELMIVVAIIAILAAIALPAYQDYTIRGQVSECGVLGSGAKTAVAETFMNTGVAPATNVAAGLALPGDITGKYISLVTVGALGVITCTYSNTAPQRANLAINAQTLTLAPGFATPGSVTWTCGGTVAEKYRPTICRTGTN